MRFSNGAFATEGSCRTAIRSAGGRSDGRRREHTRDLRLSVSLDGVCRGATYSRLYEILADDHGG